GLFSLLLGATLLAACSANAPQETDGQAENAYSSRSSCVAVGEYCGSFCGLSGEPRCCDDGYSADDVVVYCRPRKPLGDHCEPAWVGENVNGSNQCNPGL